MEELKEKYAAKTQEMKEKYADVINEIAAINVVDVGVAFEMLKAVCRGGEYAGDLEFDFDELKKDYDELVEISMQIANSI